MAGGLGWGGPDTFRPEAMTRGCSEADPLLPSGEDEVGRMKSTPEEKHAYSRRVMGCPCPAIATMINHSYLQVIKDPLPMFKLVMVLRTCYNLSFPFAILFVLAANLRLGTIRSGGFTIKHLKKHGVIEHDASISRYNQSEGDYLNPQGELVDEFIDGIDFPPGIEEWQKMITLNDYAKKRIELEDKLTSFLPQQPKFRIHLASSGLLSRQKKTPRIKQRQLINDSFPLITPISWESVRRPWLSKLLRTKARLCTQEKSVRELTEERFPWELGWENRRPGYKITLTWLISTVRQLLKRTKELEKAK
ncbi:hypothetical protein VP01_252g5 [Puccinia sorghi]|uniref:Heme haloperoxidase family profile domain-containing protein n=1 Tax=Puccinia sorghi TaxID=27349 RepID=A0A0L6V5E8_9BASI|nr:hypothetical protein VP01_252g5 [Puccinia sorghi]